LYSSRNTTSAKQSNRNDHNLVCVCVFQVIGRVESRKSNCGGVREVIKAAMATPWMAMQAGMGSRAFVSERYSTELLQRIAHAHTTFVHSHIQHIHVHIHTLLHTYA
jgi:hypothetical protein